ncbi:hypothetical protein [Niameybacter massiliensis]|uniref:hypothetical protein n=1 Tax=Niameybacter massiliensis TaxID=1658108 RepID=UPI0006B6689F|nr:hypothetical protein [Niameybacter massiliensis]
MADVTFGVKVPEEMKNELAEMMKNTQLTGKEFMSVLLSAYKLERQKQSESVLVQDIDELQRLLNRIQNMYLNMGERVNLLVEDRVNEVEELLSEKEKEKIALLEKQEMFKETLKKLEEEKETEIKALKEEKKNLEAQICGLKKEKEGLEEVVKEQKQQMKQHHVLCDKYEEEIERLKGENSKWERLEIEIEERTSENERLQVRNDEIASELWFSQREIEKSKEVLRLEIEKYTQELATVKEKYELELKNSLLEQNIIFNEEKTKIQEKYYSDMQQLQTKIQQILLNKENEKE